MPALLEYSPDLLAQFPLLVSHALWVQGILPQAPDDQQAIEPLIAQAQQRLAASPEGDWPEIQAWRRAFSQLGLKPTQYRCAAESLLRRLRKDQALPRLHPLVDLCNAVSVAYGVPVAVFDLAHVARRLTVRRADGSEAYLAFSGEGEYPEPGEVVFADLAGNAHARRWSHRQSAASAVRPETHQVLIVAEALHAQADESVARLMADLQRTLAAWWPRAVMAESRIHPA